VETVSFPGARPPIEGVSLPSDKLWRMLGELADQRISVPLSAIYRLIRFSR
jgi:hypothetical protein